MFRRWYDYDTHLFCTGGTGTGKSSLAEAWRRDRLRRGEGFLSVMSGQGVYDRFISYANYMEPRQKVIGIDLSRPERIAGCNWFSNLQNEDIGAHSSRIANAVAGAWGVKSLGDMLRYARVMQTVVRWCAESGEPIQRAAEWLDFGRTSLQE